MTAHVTTVEHGRFWTTGNEPRFRWLCSCGLVGKWTAVRSNASKGAGKHVSMLTRGHGMGVRVEEHW